MKPPALSGARGFTLLEMLVAVAVLAIALAAIISNGARYASGAASLHDKTVALIVARNRMTEIELQPSFPTVGKSDDTVKMGDVEWVWRAEVVETQDPGLRRINIRVEKKTDRTATAYATLTGFLSKVGRTAAQ
ncbi:MAG: hypothetical protein NVS9B10_11240 [Nevskia sp.]